MKPGRQAAIALTACLMLWGSAAAPLWAQPRPHPFPPAAGLSNLMKAPGLLSGPRQPLGSAPRTAYHRVLSRPVTSGPQPLFLSLLAFYRTVVSPLNGSNSDLAPVHSLYAVQAITEYGVLLGTVLTTERLLHEAGEIPFAPRFKENGRVFHHDPLVWNVFWWDEDPPQPLPPHTGPGAG